MNQSNNLAKFKMGQEYVAYTSELEKIILSFSEESHTNLASGHHLVSLLEILTYRSENAELINVANALKEYLKQVERFTSAHADNLHNCLKNQYKRISVQNNNC